MKTSIIDEAKLGKDIHIALETFSQMDSFESIIKPYGYSLCSLSTYVGYKPNVLYKRDLIYKKIHFHLLDNSFVPVTLFLN